MKNSRPLDVLPLIYSTSLLCSVLCCTHEEHVESSANIADGGSHVGVFCPFAKRLGVTWSEHQWPTLGGGHAGPSFFHVRDWIIGGAT